MSEAGARAAEILSRHAVATILPGLDDDEFQRLESRFFVRFGDEHRAFLAAGLPAGPGWPDWRSPEEMAIRLQLGRAARELHRHGADPALVARAGRVLPVYGVAFTEQLGAATTSAVWAVEGARVTLVAHDLADFVEWLCGGPTPDVDARPMPESVFAPAPVITYPELGAPPFRPDPVDTVVQMVAPPADPVPALHALGVPLGPPTRHPGALADGGDLLSVPVEPGSAAVELWEAVRARFPNTGLWPLLVTRSTWHRIGPEGSPSPIVAELDSADWLQARYDEYGGEDALTRDPVTIDAADTDWRQEWVGFRPETYDRLVLVPAWADWLVPARLGWSGAVNYGVEGAEHATMLRRWSDHWGTELVALDDEFMTLRVRRPPTVEDARTCALEAYLYCPDAVDQGFRSVDGLGCQMVRSMWSLWWD